jgi:hypothetical protein
VKWLHAVGNPRSTATRRDVDDGCDSVAKVIRARIREARVKKFHAGVRRRSVAFFCTPNITDLKRGNGS